MNRKTVFLLAVSSFFFHASHAQRSVNVEGIRLTLTSVKVLEDTLFFEFRLTNQSLLRYHLRWIRCYTQNRSTPKRTAVQQDDQEPVDSLALQPVAPASSSRLIVPYPAFAVPNHKNLFIKFGDQSSAQVLQLEVSGRRFRRMVRKY